jgi:hypothetical protein
MTATTTNPWVGVNYLPTLTSMQTPPAYWLQRLYDFDAQLVVFPSQKVPFAYVLARRRYLTAGMTDSALEATIDQPDTKTCLRNGLVPVTMIYRTGTTWSIDNIIASLKARDVWAVGGADKAADLLDDADDKLKKQIAASTRDDLWNRSGDAWRSYQARTGQRTRPTLGMHVPNSRPGTANPTGASGSTAGSGVTIQTAFE